MNKIIDMPTVADYCNFFGVETLHPLVSVVNFADFSPKPNSLKRMGFYCVFLKEKYCGELHYGRTKYDYQDGTLVFSGPGQVMGVSDGRVLPNAQGMGLIFHPDLLYGTPLARRMKDYTFFKYESNEALHMSERERNIIKNCLLEIKEELEHGIDKHTKQIVASNIETLLNHSVRFYDRQFITREPANRDILVKFENLLHDYFKSDRPKEEGLPTVKYFADRVFLSPNYFGDLIKKETGRTAQEYIKMKIIELAEQMLLGTEKTVNEISYELGFQYSQHFNRTFKNTTGKTPNQYRKS